MNATPIRLLIHGANGRMGQALQRLCDEASGCSVVAAVSRKVGPRVIDGIPQFAASELPGAPEFDVAIDFSLPEGFDAILGLCVARGKPLVSGTTGLSDAQVAALDAAAIGCICLMAVVAVFEERKIRREKKIQQLNAA